MRTLAAIENVRRLYADLEAMQLTLEAELQDCQQFVRGQRILLDLMSRVEGVLYYKPNPITNLLQKFHPMPSLELNINNNPSENPSIRVNSNPTP